MVIDEKGLMRAMNVAYKADGYKVAVEDSADTENVIISSHSGPWLSKSQNCPGRCWA